MMQLRMSEGYNIRCQIYPWKYLPDQGFHSVVKDSENILKAKVAQKEENKGEVILVCELLSRHIEQTELWDHGDELEKNGDESELIDVEHDRSDYIINDKNNEHDEVKWHDLVQVSVIDRVRLVEEEEGERIQGSGWESREVEVVRQIIQILAFSGFFLNEMRHSHKPHSGESTS